MIKLVKDLLFGEPSVSLTIVSLVLTSEQPPGGPHSIFGFRFPHR